jgi:hypothetical protein
MKKFNLQTKQNKNFRSKNKFNKKYHFQTKQSKKSR